MKHNKYIVKIFDRNNELEQERKFKTLPEIANEYNLELHMVRAIYGLSEKIKTKKFFHPENKEIYQKFKIFLIKREFIDGRLIVDD
jgi:hypothetical protein